MDRKREENLSSTSSEIREDKSILLKIQEDNSLEFVIEKVDLKLSSGEVEALEFYVNDIIYAKGVSLPSNVEYKTLGDKYLITADTNKTSLKTSLDGTIMFEMINEGPDLWYGTPGNYKVLKSGSKTYVNQPTNGDFRIGSELRSIRIIVSEPVVAKRVDIGEVKSPVIYNEGSAESYPKIMLKKLEDSKAVIQIRGRRIEYVFPRGENEVIIDTLTKKAEYKGENRDAFMTLYDDIKLLPGDNILNVSGDAEVYIIRKDRWI